MTDTLTALEAAKYQLGNDAVWIGGDDSQYGYSEDIIGAIHETVGKIDAAITSLTEPFDPAKHLEGWVKTNAYDDERWLYGEHKRGWVLRRYNDRWILESKFYNVHMAVDIPTASFFHALCGALNIK